MAVVVTIGRNVGPKPMPAEEWDAFKANLRKLVAMVGPIYFAGEGWGASEQWGQETAYTVVGEEPWGPDKGDLVNVLADLGRRYNQEAVAVTFGRTMFV